MLGLKRQKGQSIIEYVLLFAAVVAVIVAVVYGAMNKGVGQVFNKAGDALNTAADNMNFEFGP